MEYKIIQIEINELYDYILAINEEIIETIDGEIKDE